MTAEFETAQPDAPPIDPGNYRATLVAIDFETVDFGEGPETKARWSWQVHDEVDHEGRPLIVKGLTGLKYGNEKANLTIWSQALGWTEARHPTPADIIGRDAMVELRLNDRGYLAIKSVTSVPKTRGSKAS